MQQEERSFWRLPRVCEETGLAPSTVKLYAKSRPDFPKAITLGTGQTRARGVVWVASEVRAWMDARIRERDEKQSVAA